MEFLKRFMTNNKESGNNISTVGHVGAGRELKTIDIWCKKEFGIDVPIELKNDTGLYTHKEVWQLLDPYVDDHECIHHNE